MGGHKDTKQTGLTLSFALRPAARRIVSDDSDLFAVVLYNTARAQRPPPLLFCLFTPASFAQRSSKNALHFEHVVTLETPNTSAIDVPTARRILQLRRLPGAWQGR